MVAYIQRHAPTLKPAPALFSITWRFIRQPKISNLETSSLLKPTRLERWVFALNKVDAIYLGKDQGRQDKNANATLKRNWKFIEIISRIFLFFSFLFFQVELLVSFMRACMEKKIKIIITVNLRLDGIYREIKFYLEILMNLTKKWGW